MDEALNLAFEHACETGQVEEVKRLLARDDLLNAIDVNANGGQAFSLACSGGHIDVVHALLQHTGPPRIEVSHADLTTACSKGHLPVVRALLALTGDRQVDVNADGGTALTMACARGHTYVVRELLACAGALQVNVHQLEQRALLAAHINFARSAVREMLLARGQHTAFPHAVVGADLRRVGPPRGPGALLAAALAEALGSADSPPAKVQRHQCTIALHALVESRRDKPEPQKAIPQGHRQSPKLKVYRLAACLEYCVACAVYLPSASNALREVLHRSQCVEGLRLAAQLRQGVWGGAILDARAGEGVLTSNLPPPEQLSGASCCLLRREGRCLAVLHRVASRAAAAACRGRS